MHHLKKFSFFAGIIFIFLFFAPFSFAVPGQLIYDANTSQADNSQCTEALSTCGSLYTSCQLQQSQQEKSITTLTNNLNQEKQKTMVLGLTFGVVVVSSVLAIVILRQNLRRAS